MTRLHIHQSKDAAIGFQAAAVQSGTTCNLHFVDDCHSEASNQYVGLQLTPGQKGGPARPPKFLVKFVLYRKISLAANWRSYRGSRLTFLPFVFSLKSGSLSTTCTGRRTWLEQYALIHAVSPSHLIRNLSCNVSVATCPTFSYSESYALMG